MNKMFEFFKNKKMFFILLAVLAAGALAILGFYSTSASELNQSQAVKVVALDLAETVDVSGSLEAQPFSELNWKTSGVVETVFVKAGQDVKKGDILLTLQPDSTSASVASARADLVEAQQNLEDLIDSDAELAQAIIDLRDAEQKYVDKAGYLKYLQTNDNVPLIENYGWFKKGKNGGWTAARTSKSYRGPATESMLIVAENNAELARAEVEDLQRKIERLKNKDQDILAAQARVDAAQATVNSMSIIAPFDGKVLSVKHRAGDVVGAGDLSVKIADLDHLYIETQVDESDIAKIKMGNPADVTLDAVEDVTFTGKVSAINPVGEVVSGLVKYTVRVELDKVTSDTFLPLGTTANVTIQTKSASATLAAPIAAIQNDSNGEYVWVIQSDNSTKRVDIVSGSIIGDMVVVTGDLREGDALQLVQASSFQAPNPLGGGSSK